MKSQSFRLALSLLAVSFLLLVVLGFLVLLTPLGGKVKRGLKEVFGPDRELPAVQEEVPSSPPEEEPEPLGPLESDPDPIFPTGVLTPPDGVDIRSLSKGINLKVTFESTEGGVASRERLDDEAYVAEYTLKVRMPQPAQTMEALTAVNPRLSQMLPGLPELLDGPDGAKVSAWYRQLYANKAERLKAKVGQLDDILTRHNFYDCETILNLRHPGSGRRVFLLQAEMDVVSDGSDGDRLPTMPDEIVNSTNYQPFTSYRWKKTGQTPNPMIAGWETRIGNAKREMAAEGTTAARKKWLQDRITMLERGIADMKYASYLIAEYDPFIVIPMNILTDREDPYAPNIGDFAVVVHENHLYPAIVGDAGPTFKVGEASLRLAKEIRASSNPYSRPVSDLTVTYLVFPRTADEPKRAPDYEHWRQRCGELLEEIGGLGDGVALHQWEDLLPKPAPESTDGESTPE